MDLALNSGAPNRTRDPLMLPKEPLLASEWLNMALRLARVGGGLPRSLSACPSLVLDYVDALTVALVGPKSVESLLYFPTRPLC